MRMHAYENALYKNKWFALRSYGVSFSKAKEIWDNGNKHFIKEKGFVHSAQCIVHNSQWLMHNAQWLMHNVCIPTKMHIAPSGNSFSMGRVN
jgi:hypothetical protein